MVMVFLMCSLETRSKCLFLSFIPVNYILLQEKRFLIFFNFDSIFESSLPKLATAQTVSQDFIPKSTQCNAIYLRLYKKGLFSGRYK